MEYNLNVKMSEYLPLRDVVFNTLRQAILRGELAPGERLIVDTGNLAMMEESCSIDIQAVKGVKNALLGGEGLFNTVVTGPGRIVLQTMPLSSFASAISSVLPSKS